ncbi:hypothetical protein GDO81_022177 [Engystomops pustulosus]|uniref:Uncharacterized protein n=1 Tax=Engystomops pustulosus TaxID=76066 RepID=A0AAV6YU87_ENGPU|nr:hypothetical protein GDO81_022177 [Engystomops pustulosus]
MQSLTDLITDGKVLQPNLFFFSLTLKKKKKKKNVLKWKYNMYRFLVFFFLAHLYLNNHHNEQVPVHNTMIWP